ncbi:MAG TPA: hypothetical protein VF326_00940 [Anaerolineaceae bacterium]
MSLAIELEGVRQTDKSVLRNLLELCHHDYSEFNQADVDEHGLYGYISWIIIGLNLTGMLFLLK